MIYFIHNLDKSMTEECHPFLDFGISKIRVQIQILVMVKGYLVILRHFKRK